MSSIYILDIRPLSDLGIVKIFRQSLGCRFVLMKVCFAVEKIFSLILFHYHLLISESEPLLSVQELSTFANEFETPSQFFFY